MVMGLTHNIIKYYLYFYLFWVANISKFIQIDRELDKLAKCILIYCLYIVCFRIIQVAFLQLNNDNIWSL